MKAYVNIETGRSSGMFPNIYPVERVELYFLDHMPPFGIHLMNCMGPLATYGHCEFIYDEKGLEDINRRAKSEFPPNQIDFPDSDVLKLFETGKKIIDLEARLKPLLQSIVKMAEEKTNKGKYTSIDEGGVCGAGPGGMCGP